VPADPIEGALTEAERRLAISDRDLSASVAHFVSQLRHVCAEWGLTPVEWFPGGAGTPTLAVTRQDGTAAVLKVAEPGVLDAAARVMAAATGHGYAEVLRWDPHRGALLTERLGHDLWTEAPTLMKQSQVTVTLLSQAWCVPLDRGSPFQGKASRLLAILADLGPRYGAEHRDALALATHYATGLASTERPEVVCHGDPHAGNVLRRGSGWALVDPDGFVGERTYDLGVILRDACREIMALESVRPRSGIALLHAACRSVAEATGVNPERVWRWAFVERVTTGLYLRWFGRMEESVGFLETATLVARRTQPDQGDGMDDV
jgi:streptomycin 6-kinase